MASQNMQIVRGAFAAIRRGDIDWLVSHAADDLEFLPLTQSMVDGRAYLGPDAFRRWDADRWATWDEFELRTDEFLDFGSRILVHGEIRARGRASGAEVTPPVSWVIELRDERFVRIEAFFDRAKAEATAASD